jgi:hypothetical protein
MNESKKEESKRSKRKSSKEHGKSLSLVTNAFVELGEVGGIYSPNHQT